MENNILTADLIAYKESVANLARNNINCIMPNSGDAHALIVLEAIFENSTNIVKMACGTLDKSFTSNSDYLSSIKRFLEKSNSKLEILLTEYQEAKFKNSDIHILFKSFTDKVFIKKTSDFFFDTEPKNKVHFCIGDDKFYRYETNIEKRTAIFNINDPKVSKQLSDEFEKCFHKDNAQEITL